mgnify:CR=1 FL=1
MNAAFSAEGIDGADGEVVESWRPSENTGLVDSIRRHPQIDLPEFVLEFVDTFPSAMKRAVQALVWENFIREVRVPITFAWQPGYDYSITVHDVSDTTATRGGITVVFTSRYPGDEHPLARTAGI